jgi:hypothetical protein
MMISYTVNSLCQKICFLSSYKNLLLAFLRDFQKLNSSSCGMGILARPKLKAGRMPTPQENFEDFFIWKSLNQVRYSHFTLKGRKALLPYIWLRRFPVIDTPKSPAKLGDFIRLLAPLFKGGWGDQFLNRAVLLHMYLTLVRNCYILIILLH